MPRNPDLDRSKSQRCTICRRPFVMGPVGRPRKICQRGECQRSAQAKRTRASKRRTAKRHRKVLA